MRCITSFFLWVVWGYKTAICDLLMVCMYTFYGLRCTLKGVLIFCMHCLLMVCFTHAQPWSFGFLRGHPLAMEATITFTDLTSSANVRRRAALPPQILPPTGTGPERFAALPGWKLVVCDSAALSSSFFTVHQKLRQGLNPNGPRSVSCETELLDTQGVSGSVQSVLLEMSCTQTKNRKSSTKNSRRLLQDDASLWKTSKQKSHGVMDCLLPWSFANWVYATCDFCNFAACESYMSRDQLTPVICRVLGLYWGL